IAYFPISSREVGIPSITEIYAGISCINGREPRVSELTVVLSAASIQHVLYSCRDAQFGPLRPTHRGRHRPAQTIVRNRRRPPNSALRVVRDSGPPHAGRL